MCLLIWIILFNWITLMESGSLLLWVAQTNGEQLASSCDQSLAFIRRELQAPQAAWQDDVPTAPISQHFCSFPLPSHIQGEPRSQCGPEPAWSGGHEHHCHLPWVHQLHGQQDSPPPLSRWMFLIWTQTRLPWLCILPFPPQYGMSDLLYTDTWENVDYLFAIVPSLFWSSPNTWAKGHGWYAFKDLH